MPFTRGAREVPNQTDLPPSLPDTSGWVRRQPGDVIEAGTPYVQRTHDGALHYFKDGLSHRVTIPTDERMAFWTPPPVPRPAWADLSEDWDQPTLAKVTWKNGSVGGDFVAAVYVAPHPIDSGHRLVMFHNGMDPQPVVGADLVTHVELLDTYSPETHVPVERALIDAIVHGSGEDRRGALDELAALADGAQS